MTNRILLSPTRVSVSRPGYDVVSPPAITEDYLAVDSSFPAAVRLYTSGVIFGWSINTFVANFVNFGTTFSSYPYVLVISFDAGNPTTLHNLYMKWTSGTPDNYCNPYQVNVFKNRFRVGAAQTGDPAYNNLARNWLYFVFAP